MEAYSAAQPRDYGLPQECLDAIQVRSLPEEDHNQALTWMITQFEEVLRAHRPVFSPLQWAYLCTILEQTIVEASPPEKPLWQIIEDEDPSGSLAEECQLDELAVSAVNQRLIELDPIGMLSILDVARRFWAVPQEEGGLEAVVTRLLVR